MSKRAGALDISFSPCFGNVPAVPFLENVVGTPSRGSLTYFAANHVKGDIGWNALEYFSNLKYLDLSFTDLDINHFRAAMMSLCHLEHLNLSGTSLTWYEVFSTSDVFASDGLMELFMHSLVIMSAGDWKAGKGRQSSVEGFFGKFQRLLSLDVSYAIVSPDEILMNSDSYCDGRFYITLCNILRCPLPLTHLDVSYNIEWDLSADLLVKADRLDQLRFLGNISEDWCVELPETLTSRPNLKLANYAFLPGVLCFEYQFHQSHALKNSDYFYYSLSEIQDAVTKDYDRFVDNGLVPLTLMLSAAVRRCLTDEKFYDKSVLPERLFSHVPASVCTNSPFLRNALEQMLENLLLFTLRRKSRHREHFTTCVMSLLATFSTFVADRRILCNLALQYYLHLNAQDHNEVALADKWALLAQVLAAISQLKRKRLTIKISPQMKSDMVYVVSEIRHVSKSNVSSWSDIDNDVLEGGKYLLNTFVVLFGGLPASVVLSAFDGHLPIVGIAALAHLPLKSFSLDADERRSNLYIASLEALAVIAESPYLAPALFCKTIFDAVVAQVPSVKSMLVAYSYLACLLLVHDESASGWPLDCDTREGVAAHVVSGDLFDVESTYRYTTVLPLMKIARSTEFVSVATFGLQRLAFYGSRHFDADAYHSQYSGPCPVCLIRKEDFHGSIVRVVPSQKCKKL